MSAQKRPRETFMVPGSMASPQQETAKRLSPFPSVSTMSIAIVQQARQLADHQAMSLSECMNEGLFPNQRSAQQSSQSVNRLLFNTYFHPNGRFTSELALWVGTSLPFIELDVSFLDIQADAARSIEQVSERAVRLHQSGGDVMYVCREGCCSGYNPSRYFQGKLDRAIVEAKRLVPAFDLGVHVKKVDEVLTHMDLTRSIVSRHIWSSPVSFSSCGAIRLGGMRYGRPDNYNHNCEDTSCLTLFVTKGLIVYSLIDYSEELTREQKETLKDLIAIDLYTESNGKLARCEEVSGRFIAPCSNAQNMYARAAKGLGGRVIGPVPTRENWTGLFDSMMTSSTANSPTAMGEEARRLNFDSCEPGRG